MHKFILTGPRTCKVEDDLNTIFYARTPTKRFRWVVIISPYYLRSSRVLNFDGRIQRVPFNVDPLIHRQATFLMYAILVTYPLFTFIALFLLAISGPIFANIVYEIVFYTTHIKLREWIRRKAIEKEKIVRTIEIWYTPKGGKIVRLYKMFPYIRRTDSSSEPRELAKWDKELLIKHKRVRAVTPMTVKFAYFFDKKNLIFDEQTQLIIPKPTSSDDMLLSFEQRERLMKETKHWEARLAKSLKDRAKFDEARRLVYNIPNSRLLAIQQGVPYVPDRERREIMYDVKKAQRAKILQKALAKDQPDPFPKREVSWLENSKARLNKISRTKVRPTTAKLRP